MKKFLHRIVQRTRGRDTIFGGSGKNVYWLSNGDNWLDAGGGNDRITGGADILAAGAVLFGRVFNVAANDKEGRVAA